MLSGNQWKYNEALLSVGDAFANAILRNAARKQEEAERIRKEEEAKRKALLLQNVIQSLREKTYDYGTQITNPITGEPYNLGNIVPENPQPDFRNFFPQVPPAQNIQSQPLQQIPDVIPAQTFRDALFNAKGMDSHSGNQKPIESQYREKTPEEKTIIASQLLNTPGGISALEDYYKLQNMFKPKPDEYSNIVERDGRRFGISQKTGVYEEIPGSRNIPGEVKPQKTVKIGRQIFLQDPLIEGKPIGEPIFEYQPKIEYKDKKVFDSELGLIKTFTEKYVDGELENRSQPVYRSPKEVKNGVTYLSKGFKGELDKLDLERRKLYAEKEKLYQLGIKEDGDAYIETVNKQGDLTRISASDIAKRIAENRVTQVSMVKQSAPPEFKEWYNKVWNYYGKQDPDMNEFVQEFLDAYRSGAFKKVIKVRNTKTGETRTIIDPGAEAMNYFSELTRALYGSYPDKNMIQSPEEETEIIKTEDQHNNEEEE